MYSFSVVASPIIGYYMIKKGSFCLILYCDRNIILLVKCYQQSTSSKIILIVLCRIFYNVWYCYSCTFWDDVFLHFGWFILHKR